MTTKSSISQEAADAWRDFILQQVVSSLETNRDKILDDYEAVNRHGLSRADIEQHELLDFDISKRSKTIREVSGRIDEMQNKYAKKTINGSI
jgi:hypothetical protein